MFWSLRGWQFLVRRCEDGGSSSVFARSVSDEAISPPSLPVILSEAKNLNPFCLCDEAISIAITDTTARWPVPKAG